MSVRSQNAVAEPTRGAGGYQDGFMMRALIGLVVALALSSSVVAQAGDELPRKGTFGASLGTVPEDLQKKHSLKAGEGFIVGQVAPGLTADSAGAKTNDILIAINGKPINGMPAVMDFVNSVPSGQPVQITVLRDGKRTDLQGKMVAKPKDPGTNQYEVAYSHVVSNGKRMRTIISKPKKPGKHPAIMLIQGLGPSTVDQFLSAPGSYSKIFKPFAEGGFVTVRVDKPGVGDSEGGPYAQVDYMAELDIYRQALRATKELPYVDAENVFIFGHSMGGAFGPMIAAEIPIKGLAVYGVASKTWIEYWLENTRRQAILQGSTYVEVDNYEKKLASFMHFLFNEGRTPEWIKENKPELKEVLESEMPEFPLMSGRVVTFWQQLAQQNFAEWWTKSNTHVLAIWGENEFITTREDHPLIADIVNKANPGKGSWVALPQTDHGFKKTTSMEDSFRRWGQGGEFNPNIITTLQEWVARVMKETA